MSDMTEFFRVMLGIINDFLSAEPMIYIVGLVLLILFVKVFRVFMP